MGIQSQGMVQIREPVMEPGTEKGQNNQKFIGALPAFLDSSIYSIPFATRLGPRSW